MQNNRKQDVQHIHIQTHLAQLTLMFLNIIEGRLNLNINQSFSHTQECNKFMSHTIC